MRKIELKGQKASYIKAIDVLNTNLCELEKELAKVAEVENVTLELIQRFNNGLQLSEFFAEKAEEYIVECRPAPLESVKKIIREDFKSRIPSDMNVHERISMVRGLYGWFQSQTREAPDIVRLGNSWQVAATQQKRLLDSCTVTLSAKQSAYISLLDEVVAARHKLANWERENNIDSSLGISYMKHPDTVYSLIREV